MENEVPILILDILNEMDIMLAHRRAVQFARFAGLSLSEQTRFATAVSELCRNAVEYASHGSISYSILKQKEKTFLQAIVKDRGRGIQKLNEILERSSVNYKGRGLGIIYARKLTDKFQILSTGSGTTVTIQKLLPAKAAAFNKTVIQGWIQQLKNEPVISAYEELKIRNTQLVELTDELKANGIIMERQMEEIQTLNGKLSVNNDKMNEFTYAISHDLKTPLSILKLSAEYLHDTPQGNEAAAYQSIMLRAVSRLDKTIQGLVEILDLQNQQTKVVRTIELSALLQQSKEDFEIKIIESGAVICSDLTETPVINYVEAYIKSLFDNLISNAIKYRGTARDLVINIHSYSNNGNVTIVFSDNGMGMDLSKIGERLFVPFNRFSTIRDGRGVGLYLVKGMIEANGGHIDVQSKEGEGTTFTIELVPYPLAFQ